MVEDYANTNYASDFESDVLSEVASVGSSRIEDDLTPVGVNERGGSVSLNPPTDRVPVARKRPTPSQMIPLDAYQRHKKMVNDYIQYYGGSSKEFKRDTSNDKRDIDVIRANSRFVWEDKDNPATWEERLAKYYWDRLYKEYAIADLSRFKEKKLGLRWRSRREVISGKGQFICGSVHCAKVEFLRSWEVDFVYRERGEKRNVLVKVRLCPECSAKLNYHKQYTEASKKKVVKGDTEESKEEKVEEPEAKKPCESDFWKNPSASTSQPQIPDSQRTLEDEFDEYLKNMFM